MLVNVLCGGDTVFSVATFTKDVAEGRLEIDPRLDSIDRFWLV